MPNRSAFWRPETAACEVAFDLQPVLDFLGQEDHAVLEVPVRYALFTGLPVGIGPDLDLRQLSWTARYFSMTAWTPGNAPHLYEAVGASRMTFR